MLDEQFYSTELPETLANVLACGDAGKLLQGLPEPWPEHQAKLFDVKPYGVDAIPTLDGADSLLASVRVPWRQPKALQRANFEATFRMQARAVVTLEDVLARLRAHIFNTPTDFARFYGKAASWAGSMMWCCLRDGLVPDIKTWRSFFPKVRPYTRSLTRKG